ncbi:MAG: alpha/beta hydrolase-fold protein [Bacteroidota bacterium]
MKNFVLLFALAHLLAASSTAQNVQVSPGDTLQSVSMTPSGITTFRIYAPQASNVKIGGSDIPETFRNHPLTRESNGVWEVTVGPVPPGAYRYTFLVDGMSVMDPRNPSVSESNENAWSMIYVPGADFMETKNVPHGAVAKVTYYSESLHRFRSMHVYTPPGYEAGDEKYPVFYLLHGAFDCDDSWSTVGRAGFILDNLLAEKKAVPMVVVMPAGHTGPFSFARMNRGSAQPARDEFIEDFVHDIRPYVEKNYRVFTNRQHRAIAGLSMGGAQTLDIAIPNLSEYSCIGVFSSGIFELGGMNFRGGNENGVSWEERNMKALDDASLKKGLSVFWFATGKEDFLLKVSQNTVGLFKKHGFDVVFHETSGAHTWNNWREYLNEFAQLLFK